MFQSNGGYPTFFEPGFNTCKYPHDERLAVIDEVDEKDMDCTSIASTGFDSGHVRSLSEDEWTRHTGIIKFIKKTLTIIITELSTDTKIAPIPPPPCSEFRRQSQPLIHFHTLESFKPRHSLPFVQNT